MRFTKLLFFTVLMAWFMGYGPKISASTRQKDTQITFTNIEQALIQAETLNARIYAKNEMLLANQTLAQARKASRPAEQQKMLKETLAHLAKACELSEEPYRQQYLRELDQFFQKAQNNGFSTYASEEIATLTQQVQLTKQLVNQEGLNEKTRYIYNRTWQNIQNFVDTTAKNVAMVEEFGTFVHEQYEKKGVTDIDNQLTKASQALQKKQLSQALQDYQEALKLLNKNQADAEFKAKLAHVDRLIETLQGNLVRSNKLFIVKPNGSISSLNPFDPQAYLAAHPLIANPTMPVLFHNISYTDLHLLSYDIVNIDEPTPKKLEVAADVSDEGLFEQAICLWQEGITTRNAGYLDHAQRYLQCCQEYLAAFKKCAIMKIYTVQNRPTQHDTLYRIAGFKDIYNDPALWPLLWKRNKDQISHPDVLHPGQKLLVPPID